MQELAHTVLGAAVAAAGGNNALTAGLSAGGAEAAAPVLSSFLYGKEAKDLTAEQKSTISSIVGLAGTALGATTGDVVSKVQSGQVAQNAVENNALENVLLPHEIDEIKKDQNGQYAKDQLQAIKDNNTYKINADGDFIVCVKVAGFSCAPREGERYATQEEILEKGGEAVATAAASWGAAKLLEPIVVVAKDSGAWSKLVGSVKEWFGKINPEEKITVFRVDDSQFNPRINLDGEVSVVTTKSGNERALFLNFGDESRAHEFAIINRKGEATITAVDVDQKLLEKLRQTSIYYKSDAAKLSPTAPIVVDVNKAIDQYGLRTPEQIQMFREALDPKSVRLIPLDPNKVPKK